MRKRKDPEPEMDVGGLFTEEELKPEPAAPSLEAYQMKICRRDMTDWENLFKGFDEIHVITYSVGLAQVRKVMKFFRTGDIIIGCPSLIQQNTAELFAEQEFSLKTVCENPYLQSRIKDGSFHVYAANRHIHSKEYLLKAEDGRTRLILGSANFSVQAWGGGQKEIYLYEDNSEFFESFMEEYRILLEESSSEIGIQAQPVQEDGSNLTDLPALKKIVETNKALVVEPAPQEETDYCFESERGKKEWEKLVEKSGIRPDPMGKIIIKPKSVIRMESEKRKNYEEKKAQMVINPELFIDYDHKTVSFDGKRWDLAPDVKQVREDISCLYQYIEGCDAFTGDTIQMKKRYKKRAGAGSALFVCQEAGDGAGGLVARSCSMDSASFSAMALSSKRMWSTPASFRRGASCRKRVRA